jgi:hypothetical protein
VAEAVKDRWEQAGALAVPPIAFGNTEVGVGFFYGVVLPCPVEGPFHNRPYVEVFDQEPRKIIAKEGPFAGQEVDNPAFGQPKRWPVRGPVHPSNPLLRPDGHTPAIGEPKQITVFHLAICGLEVDGKRGDHFDGIQLMSPNAVENFRAASKAGSPEDLQFLEQVKHWGLRRLFDTGGSLQPQLDKAIRSTTRKPIVGAIISVHVAEKKPRALGFERIFAVEYLAPTRESLAMVDAYMKAPVFIEARQADAADQKSQEWGGTQHDTDSAPANNWTAPAAAPAAPSMVPATPAAGSEDEPPF